MSLDAVGAYERLLVKWDKKPSGNVLAAMIDLANPLYTGLQRSVYRVIADQMQMDGDGWTRPLRITSRTKESIARRAGCSRSTVQRAFRSADVHDLMEIRTDPGQPSCFRLRSEAVIANALEVTTATVQQLAANVLVWRPRAAVAPVPGPAAQTWAPGPPPAPILVQELACGPWKGLTPTEADEVLDTAIRRVTGMDPTAAERTAVKRCWQELGVSGAQLLEELEAWLLGMEDGCRSFAFRFLRGEVPMDNGGTSIDHRREVKFIFQARYWRMRLGESRCHDNGDCGCHIQERRERPPKPDRTRPSPRVARPEVPPAQDVRALWFGYGKPEGAVCNDLNAAWSGCLARLRAIHTPIKVAPFLDGARIRLTDDGLEVLFRGREAVYHRGYVMRHLAEELSDWLGCRIGLILEEHGPPR